MYIYIYIYTLVCIYIYIYIYIYICTHIHKSQADYHLKELSMGEYDQPIVGMKSCFDFAEMEGFGKEWSAREWFVMRKAEIHTSEDDNNDNMIDTTTINSSIFICHI